MTGFIDRWKGFMEGELTEKEALNFLQHLDTEKAQKALGNELNRAWKEVSSGEFESEIAGIIQRINEDRQKKTKPTKTNEAENKKLFITAIKWAACIGAGLLLFFSQINNFTLLNGDPPGQEQNENEWVTRTNPKGIKTKILLPDGSMAFLNSSSTLIYARIFKTNRYIQLGENGHEAFANFRRTGYPNLTPNPYPGSDINGDFIRRLSYPDAEFSVNNENVQAALNRQGPDNLDTRVWWDMDSGNDVASIN